MVGPGYSPILEKLVSKTRTGQFIDLAHLLAEHLKAQETEPQPYLDGKLLVTSSKKRIQEITDIVTWVEAFKVYSWILCNAHPSRWQDMTQYKLLILKTSRQFPGKAWLHYDIAFHGGAASSGLLDWSCVGLGLYSFHTRAALLQHWYRHFDDYFEFCRSKNTRANHPYKIQTKLAKVNSFKYSFFVRIVNDWNSLPNHLFTDEINVNKFKRGLKTWMKIY